MDKPARQNLSATIKIDGQLPPSLVSRLTIGSQINGRLIHDFGDQKYLFRIMGRNLVLRSSVPLPMWKNQVFIVKETSPRIHLVPRNGYENQSSTNSIYILA